jgi:hypothetical protein
MVPDSPYFNPEDGGNRNVFYITEDHCLMSHRHGNLKSYTSERCSASFEISQAQWF